MPEYQNLQLERMALYDIGTVSCYSISQQSVLLAISIVNFLLASSLACKFFFRDCKSLVLVESSCGSNSDGISVEPTPYFHCDVNIEICNA